MSEPPVPAPRASYPGLEVADGELRVAGKPVAVSAVVARAMERGPGVAAHQFGLTQEELQAAMSATFELLGARGAFAELLLALAASERADIEALLEFSGERDRAQGAEPLRAALDACRASLDG